MSVVKANKRLTLEDFPTQKDWLGRLISPINDFISDVTKILNGGVVFADQTLGKEHEFRFTYQSDAISLPIGFAWNYLLPPRSLIVTFSTENGSTFIPLVAWEYTDKGQVQLTRIVKITTAPAVSLLTANSEYKIRVRVTP